MQRPILTLGLLLLGASVAQAQYVPYYPPQPNAYYGGGGGGGIYGRQGGALYGASTVMNAYGNVINQQEQARVGRQQYYQEKIKTKRMAFDEMMYEKANTPSWTEEQEKVQSTIVRRIMGQPQPSEVTSGKAANILLPYLQALSGQGIQGPPVPLDPDLMKQINVTAQGKGNLGLLRNGGALDWPPLLTGTLQKKIDSQLPMAVKQVVKGKLDPKLYLQLNTNVKTLQEEWRKKFHKEEIDGGTYLDGKHYLDSLSSAVTMLPQPGTRNLLAANQALQANDVQQLIANMSRGGLKFAPAVPGEEAAYFALQDAMVAYARGAQTDSAFQVRNAVPIPAGAPR